MTANLTTKRTRLELTWIGKDERPGLEPRILRGCGALAHGLRDEETAFRIEAAVSDLFGLDTLTNDVRGSRSLQLGRIPPPELTMYYAAKPVTVEVPAL